MLRISQSLVNDAKVQKFIKEMPEAFLKAMTSATNTTMKRMHRSTSGLVIKAWSLPKFPDDVEMKVERAKAGDEHPIASLVIRGGMNTVYKMSSKTRHISGGGVNATLFGKTHTFKHAFVAQMASGHVGIFENRGRISKKTGKPAIDELYTISTPQLAEDAKREEVPNELAQQAQRRFEQAFLSTCDRYLKKAEKMRNAGFS
jgi:hypothetical protein